MFWLHVCRSFYSRNSRNSNPHRVRYYLCDSQQIVLCLDVGVLFLYICKVCRENKYLIVLNLQYSVRSSVVLRHECQIVLTLHTMWHTVSQHSKCAVYCVVTYIRFLTRYHITTTTTYELLFIPPDS